MDQPVVRGTGGRGGPEGEVGKKTGEREGREYRLQACGEWGMGLDQEQLVIEVLSILGP